MNEAIQDGSHQSPFLPKKKTHARGQVLMGQREYQRNVFDDRPQLLPIEAPPSPIQSFQSMSRISSGRPKQQISKFRKKADSGLEFKSEFTRFEKTKIVLYHWIEPFLLGSVIGTSLQISQFSTIVYLSICLFLVMPFVLTSDMQKVKMKLALSGFMIVLSATVVFFKLWVYFQFTVTLNVDNNLQEFFGIYSQKAAKTFTIDSLVCLVSAILVWHYSSQLYQLNQRAQSKSTLKYQTSIKLLHVVFGDSITWMYLVAFGLFTIDTLMYQTVITLLVSVAQLSLLYFWAFGKQEFVLPSKSLDISIRAMQLLTTISLVFTYCLNFGILQNVWAWLKEHPSLLQLIGIETILNQGEWLFRTNEVILGFAIVMTQVYFVARGIKEEAKVQSFNRGDSLRGSYRVNQNLDKFRRWWDYAKIEVALWSCRALCLIQTYMYHDFQSLVPLIWVLSSTMYQRSKVFVRITTWFFLPLMIAQYLFYFAVNVNGLIDQSDWPQEEIILWYKYGFYTMHGLRLGLLFVTVFTMALYTRLVFQRDAREREEEAQMWSLSKDTLYQLYYLFVLYIKYPILLVLVFSGFAKMDFYHVSLLCIFVWAAMYPAQFQRHVFWILLYSDFWLLAKYVYTLIITESETMAQPTWFTLIGIATAYDPQQSKQYFRYQMKLDQWLLVTLIFAQYRRSNVLGTDYRRILKTEQNVLNSLSVKFPLLFKAQRHSSIILNQTIVIISFLAYIVIITFTRRSLINLVTFLTILCLLLIYLSYGLKRLLKVWNIVTSYTALVLVVQLGYQFAAKAQMENKITGDLTLRQQAYMNWIGFQVFQDDRMWIEFVPYVAMFFMSVVLKQAFINKETRENQDLLLAAEQLQDEKSDSSQEYITDLERKRLDFENLHYSMQYKLSYLLWKVKPLWLLFDQVSLYLHLVSATITLAFAVYFQVALIWLAYLILYMAQTCKVQHDHQRYKQEQARRFKDSATEVGGIEMQQRQYADSSKDTRRRKLMMQDGKVVSQLLKQPEFDQKGQLEKRVLISDAEALQEFQKYKSESHLVTLRSRQQFWTVQYALLVVAFGLVYSTEFLAVKYPETGEVQVMLIENSELQNFVIFIAFWAGVYKGENKQLSDRATLVTEYYPFYIYLLLLIQEKLCQIWLQDKFKTTESKIQVFESIERQYREAIHQLRPSQNVSVLQMSSSSDSAHEINAINTINTMTVTVNDSAPSPQHPQQSKQLSALLAIKPTLSYYKSFKIVTRELVIMLVWFSIIYKQNILSFVLFVVLVIHTYNHLFPYINTFTFVRNTTLIVFIAQYALQVLCLSSYNSPSQIPKQLVYPGQNYYLRIPVYFTIWNDTVQLPWSNFFALQVGHQKLNGIWIDYCVTILLYIQLNEFNFWLIDEPHKTFPSPTTTDLLKDLCDSKPAKQVRIELLHEEPSYRLLGSFCQFLYTNFALIMIMFTLFISIFNKSLLSFGYFIFCMVLIFNSRRFFKDPKGFSNQITILRLLVPYLLTDILLQVIYQVPMHETKFQAFLAQVGFIKVWSTFPKQIFYGQQQLVVSEYLNNGVAALFLKGFTYFMVMLQMQILKSTGFRRFNDDTMINMKKHTNMIGRGMAFRQNNFVSQKVLEQAGDYGGLEKMLKHVKALVRDRDGLGLQKSASIEPIKGVVEQEYNKRLEALAWPFKLYLWLRRNFVIDIMFKHSDDHLVDMVEQFNQGRTSIRTQIEVGLMNEVRQDSQYRPKPWERLTPDFLSYKKLCGYYISLIWKIIVSHTHVLCYLFMLLAAISNGGFIYMVYPCMIFGNAFIEDQRPGKRFWYFVIIYTQIIIILQFFIQLNFWSVQDDTSITNTLYIWQKRKNLGFVHIPKDSYGFKAVLKTFYAELLVLSTVLVHITQDTLSGLFNVRIQNYESFEDGLNRYIKLTLSGVELKRYLKVYQANLIKEINYDKVVQRRNSASDVVQSDQPWFMDLDTELVKFGVDPVKVERRLSWNKETRDRLDMQTTQQSRLQKLKLMFWDSPFFTRLFPTVRQQKPGKDLYMWVTGISILMIVYIFIWYSQLAMKETTIAEQIHTSQLQTPMVVSVVVIMGFMVLDRIFYSTYVFASLKIVSKKLDTKAPLKEAPQQTENQAYYESLVPQYSVHTPYRVIKFYYVWLLILTSHFYVFFFLAKQRLCPAIDPFCNKINKNPTLLIFYMILCVYLWLQAHQIRVGLPELKQGGFMMGSYNVYSKTIFQIWYYIPFLFELRTIIDWTFSKTSLDVFQSIKLAQIQSDLYLAKCMNQNYRTRPLGQQVDWYYKAGIGGLLLVFVLGLIIVPMILFSALNPVAVPNPITEGSLSFQLGVNNHSQSIQIPLFKTTQVMELETLSAQQFQRLGFEDSSQTNQFKPDQTQSIQFSPVSDTIWVVAPPKIEYLIKVLTDAVNNTDDMVSVRAEINIHLTRSHMNEVVKSRVQLLLNSQTPNILYNLTQMIQCNSSVTEVVFPAQINLLLLLQSQQNVASPITNPRIMSGATLKYSCNANQDNYWTFTQNWDESQQELIVSFPAEGFGIFVFNQTLMPQALAAYASSILIFYATLVYIIASAFRNGFVPKSYQIFIIDAIHTEDIIMICQCIYIYRVQKNLRNEEELYMILIDIMRSPETLKSITGTSLKKKLE